jgi:hypothetical protein
VRFATPNLSRSDPERLIIAASVDQIVVDVIYSFSVALHVAVGPGVDRKGNYRNVMYVSELTAPIADCRGLRSASMGGRISIAESLSSV